MNLVVEFFRHNTLMNSRLLDACRQLSPEQIDATTVGTYGSIGATLVHIANSQVGYAARFSVADRPSPLQEEPFPGFEVLVERFSLGNALLEEAATGSDQDQQIRVCGDDPVGTWAMPASLILLQAVNHGTEHRSQIATILTQIGIDPPAMDGWNYFMSSGQMRDV